jgi:DNA-binding CsgD family transcriptional regulator
MAPEVVGREQELAVLRACIAGLRGGDGPAAVVVEGEAGIGKSTLWLAAVEHAREQGVRTLVSRPAEAEQHLAHVGLADLLEDSLDDVLRTLPAPRRRSLEVALLRREAGDDGLDPRALAVATRSALQLLARDQPLVLAVDDVQWLDDASARALAFALRRLGDEQVLVLLARRVGGGPRASGLEQALDGRRLERVSVAPLTLGAVQRLLHGRLRRTLPRPALIRLHETSGGNPLYALELARAVGGDARGPVAVPASLERLVGSRLAGLTPETREALSILAAAGRLLAGLVGAAGVSDAALTPAFEAGVVEEVGSVIRFTHPLLASALYGELSPAARRRVHRLAASVVDEPLSRARHLALASPGPDAAVALTVDQAVAAATTRGATVAAAELAEQAVRLTPLDDRRGRHRRALGAARMHLASGDVARARAAAHEVLAVAGDGRERAETLVVLSDVHFAAGALDQAIAARREALALSVEQPALQASIHRWLALVARVSEGLAVAEEHARVSLALAEGLGDDLLRSEALAVLGLLRFNAGEVGALELAEEATTCAAAAGRRLDLEASLGLVHVLTWSARAERARAVLQDLYASLSDRDELASSSVLWYLSLVELAAGRYEAAAAHADRQREISRLYAVDRREDPLAIWVVARVAAHRGELDRARELATLSLALAEGLPQIVAGQHGVLGLVEAFSGRPLEAVAHFAAADEARYGAGVRAPSLYWWRPEQVEALLELGRVEDAEELLDRWQREAARLDQERLLAEACRCRGLRAAARGELETAGSLLSEAVDRHAAAGDPFGRGRALLARGIVARRDRQKRAARDTIQAAVEAFEDVGAAGWAARARSELGRIGGRTREDGLTSAERRVAVLVADGRTNREVAAALFVGERTVETHLSRVYAKLGVRSRTELARTFRVEGQTSGERTISR